VTYLELKIKSMNSTSASPPSSRWLDVCITALAPAIWGSTYIVTTEL